MGGGTYGTFIILSSCRGHSEEVKSVEPPAGGLETVGRYRGSMRQWKKECKGYISFGRRNRKMILFVLNLEKLSRSGEYISH